MNSSYCSKLEELPYQFDHHVILSEIRESRARRILLQAPNGLKQYMPLLAKCIAEHAEVEVLLHGEGLYGACYIGSFEYYKNLDIDLVIHLGHTPYPPGLGMTPESKPKIVYIPVYSKLRLSDNALDRLHSRLKELNAHRIGVITSVQHVLEARRIARLLGDLGYNVVLPRGFPPYFMDGQVIGCDYRLALSVQGDVDAYVFVGGGLFHAIGLYLSTRKPVIKADPYRDSVEDVMALGERTLRIRYKKMLDAMDARRWGVIVGEEPGQYRPWLINKIIDLLRKRGLEYMVIVGRKTDREFIANNDSEWFQAFVITSCPRIPIDDLQDYHKPVLTPGEALMVLQGDISRYRFPW